MPSKIYHVKLTNQERVELTSLVSKGRSAARKLNHARILLLSDESCSEGSRSDKEIIDALGVSLRSVERIRQRFVEEGLESALNAKPKSRHRPKKLDGAAEAFLVATACSQAPHGHAEWTLQLLADKLVECEITDTISRETIRKTLKKMNLSLG